MADTALTPVQERFVLHWGEMGARWGINRTVAQIHAVLYLSPRPLHAEELAATLSVARSNVSNSLRELQGWGIVRVVHVLGDRRDHFESLKDVWQMFDIIVAERKRREIDPTVEMLRSCISDPQGKMDAYTTERITNMLEFLDTGRRQGAMKGIKSSFQKNGALEEPHRPAADGDARATILAP
jgi:DNA-binding transcriptional regulator GbsR (MarR family)